VEALGGVARKSFTMLAGGPPAGKAISVKVRGDDFDDIQAAADALKAIVADIPGARDVQDDNLPGRSQLQLRMDHDAIRAAGLSPLQVARAVRLSVDGEVVAFTRDEGDKIELRVQAASADAAALRANAFDLMREPVALPNGQTTTLGQLLDAPSQAGRGFIRHHNLRRTVTVEANLDKDVTDTAQANAMIKSAWAAVQTQHPNVDLDFSGELEDIEESLAAMKVLFLMGMGLHRFPLVRRFLDPFLASYYSIPTFVFYPFFIVLFGLNRFPLMAIGFIFAVVAMAINTLSGLQRVPRVLMRSARVMRLSRWQTIRLVIMPSAAPYLFTGLKLSIVYSFIGVIAGEFILSGAGLGFQIAFSYNAFETSKMYGLMAILLTVVGSINLYIYAIERRIYSRRGGR
jgi:ABC-type nitrate/sulfonate/bicarbonate transport system permease component